MTQQQDRVPQGVDMSVPCMACTDDPILGGGRHVAAGLAVGEQIEAVMPGLRRVARANRPLRGRVVRFMAS